MSQVPPCLATIPVGGGHLAGTCLNHCANVHTGYPVKDYCTCAPTCATKVLHEGPFEVFKHPVITSISISTSISPLVSIPVHYCYGNAKLNLCIFFGFSILTLSGTGMHYRYRFPVKSHHEAPFWDAAKESEISHENRSNQGYLGSTTSVTKW